MKRETAKEIIDRFEDINKSIFSVLLEFKDKLSSEEYESLRREVARMGVMADTYIYPKIIESYPDLDPIKNQELNE